MRIFIAGFQIFKRLIKQVWISVLLLLYQLASFALPHADSLRDELNRVIKDVHLYDSIKLNNIAKLKGLLLQSSPGNLDQQYEVYLQLYEQYKYYNYDSALAYTKRLQNIARNKDEPSLLMDSKLKAVFVTLPAACSRKLLIP